MGWLPYRIQRKLSRYYIHSSAWGWQAQNSSPFTKPWPITCNWSEKTVWQIMGCHRPRRSWITWHHALFSERMPESRRVHKGFTHSNELWSLATNPWNAVVELYEVNSAQTGTVVASDMAATIICDCYNIMTRLSAYRTSFKFVVYLGHVLVRTVPSCMFLNASISWQKCSSYSQHGRGLYLWPRRGYKESTWAHPANSHVSP